MYLHYSALSGKGNVRHNNQDNIFCCGNFLLEPESHEVFELNGCAFRSGVFAVADGMGGEFAGELASRIAISSLEKLSEPSDMGQLRNCFFEANDHICKISESEGGVRIGTTLALLSISGRNAFFANIGDSRIYRFREGELTQISEDHTAVSSLVAMGLLTPEDAKSHPKRNVLTQHLGIPSSEMVIEPYYQSGTVNLGDIYLLCSDGLTGFVDDELIRKTLHDYRDVLQLCSDLYAAAEDSGSNDNISIVAVRADII